MRQTSHASRLGGSESDRRWLLNHAASLASRLEDSESDGRWLLNHAAWLASRLEDSESHRRSLLSDRGSRPHGVVRRARAAATRLYQRWKIAPAPRASRPLH